MSNTNKKKSGLKDKLVLEMITYWINVLYLATIFAVFTSYKRLILAHYDISYSDWGISLIKALVLAKFIMVGGLFHFGRNLENKPLILPTLFKTVMFTLWVALFAVVESAIRGFLHGKGLNGALDHLLSEGTHEFFAKCLVVFFAFIPYFAFKELGRVLGKGKIWQLFFRK
jgi:predicted small integral membrane protein